MTDAVDIYDPEGEALKIMRERKKADRGGLHNLFAEYVYEDYNLEDAQQDPEYWKLLRDLKKIKSQATSGDCGAVQNCPYAKKVDNPNCDFDFVKITKVRTGTLKIIRPKEFNSIAHLQFVGDYCIAKATKQNLWFKEDVLPGEISKMILNVERNKLDFEVGGSKLVCKSHEAQTSSMQSWDLVHPTFDYDRSNWYPTGSISNSFGNEVMNETDTKLTLYPAKKFSGFILGYLFPRILPPDIYKIHVNRCTKGLHLLSVEVYPNVQVNYSYSINLGKKSYVENFASADKRTRDREINSLNKESERVLKQRTEAKTQEEYDALTKKLSSISNQIEKIQVIGNKSDQFNESKQKIERGKVIQENKANNEKKINDLKAKIEKDAADLKTAEHRATTTLSRRKLNKRKKEVERLRNEVAQGNKSLNEVNSEIESINREISGLEESIKNLESEIGKPIDQDLVRSVDIPGDVVDIHSNTNKSANNSDALDYSVKTSGLGRSFVAKLSIDGWEFSFAKKSEPKVKALVSQLTLGLTKFQQILSKICKSVSFDFSYPNITMGYSGGWKEIDDSFQVGYSHQLIFGANPLFGVMLEFDLLGAALLATVPPLAKIKDFVEDAGAGKIKLVIGIGGSISGNIVYAETVDINGKRIKDAAEPEEVVLGKVEGKISFEIKGEVWLGVEKKFVVQGSVGAAAGYSGSITGPHTDDTDPMFLNYSFAFDGLIITAVLMAQIGDPEGIGFSKGAPFEPIVIVDKGTPITGKYSFSETKNG